mgnify:CR=1 FL=1
MHDIRSKYLNHPRVVNTFSGFWYQEFLEKEAAATHKTMSYTKKLYTLFSDFVLPYKNKAYLCVLF